MVRLEFSIELAYQVLDEACEFVLNIHPAITPCQRVLSESLTLNQSVQPQVFIEQADGTRYVRLSGTAGPLIIRYKGVVDLLHTEAEPCALQEMAVADLPLDVIRYIYPSRYCQSDRFRDLANKEFGNMTPGYARVSAIGNWVNQRTKFTSGCSAESTSAIETLADRAGVCRDFSHLMIAMCRALSIPARFVSGIDYGSDPALGPTDFHAYVEVYLSGRWYLFDPSGLCPTMGLMRLGTGRDAADVSFATVFGSVTYAPALITIEATVDTEKGFMLPVHPTKALSTAGTQVTNYHLAPNLSAECVLAHRPFKLQQLG